MAEIHDLVLRIGRDAAKEAPPDDLFRGLSQERQGSAIAERRLSEWRRQVDWAADIMAVERPKSNWLHSGFCLVALPHTKPHEKAKPYSLKNGAFKLILTPKPIDTDENGEAIYAGLPYGSKARLILVYLQTYAVRHRTRNVVLGSSMSSWIRKLGFDNISGGERGVITAVNEQAQRIARTEFTMIWDQGRSRILRDQALVSGLELFSQRPSASDQLNLLGDGAADRRPRRRRYNWVREIEISEGFYEHLLEHRVVLAEEAIAKLKGSSWALDIYLWLSYRLRSVEREGVPITWSQLRQQFSPNHYKNNLHVFRTKVMEPALYDVSAVYPEANFRITDSGLVLRPSHPPIGARATFIRFPARA